MFQGQEHQPETGWDQYKWRNADPAIGRFFNVDPLAEEYHYWTPYAFSGNMVTAHRELEGLEPASINSDGTYNAPGDNFNYVNPDAIILHENGSSQGAGLVGEVLVGLTPAGVAVDALDFSAAASEGDGVGMFLAGVGFVPGGGDLIKAGGKLLREALQGSDEIAEGSNLVYRALREGEDPLEGLFSRAPGKDTKISSHVMGKKESNLISTTRDESKATGLFNSGNGVVEIDLNKVNGEVVDVSKGTGKGRVFSRTKSHQEVLIRDNGTSAPIPADAIRVIENPN